MKKITLVLFFCFCAVGFSQTQNTSESGDNAATNQLRGITAPKDVQQNKKVTANTKSNTQKVTSQQFRSLISESAVSKETKNVAGPKNEASSGLSRNASFEPLNRISDTRISKSGLTGPSAHNAAAGTATRTANVTGNQNRVPVVITHSVTQTNLAGNSVTCNAGGIPDENSFFRDFDLAGDFAIPGVFTVTDVEFGVDTVTGPVDLTLNIYSMTGTFPTDFGTAVLQGTATYTADVGDAQTIISVPLAATIPAGEHMIYEYRIDLGAVNSLFPASNDEGQTGISYIQAAACGLTSPGDLAAIGFADQHMVMNVVGDDGTGGVVFPAPYCGPLVFANDIEPITLVDVAGISNVTDATVNGSPGHEDFTLVVGAMEEGMSYPIALEGNTAGNFTNRFAVFIDWNQNDILDDAGEVYEITETIVNSTGTDGQQATGMIAVPAGVTAGDTRMRVKKIFGTNNYLDPCLGTGFGQVEDYTITVTTSGGGGGMTCNEENPSNGFENGIFSGSGPLAPNQVVATDITIAADTDFSLTTVNANLGIRGFGESITSADIIIYGDIGAFPDSANIIASYPAVAPTSQTILGTAFTDYEVLNVTFDIPATMLAGQAGATTTYWISIYSTASNADDVFWEATTATINGNEGVFSVDNAASWAGYLGGGTDMVYNFSGECTPIGGGGMTCNQEHPLSAAAGGGLGSSVDSDFKSASDIVVAAGEDFTIDTIDTYFLTFAPADPPTTATVVYYEDAGGLPGAMIGSETVVPTVLSSQPWANPIADQYEMTMSVTPFTFSGDAGSDTTYWIEVSMGTATNQPTVFWEYTNDTPVEGNSAAQFDGTVGTWSIPDPLQETVYNYSGECTPIAPPTDNDTCADATAVACGDVVVSDTLTNTDTGGNAAPDEWFSFTGTGAAEIVTISLCDGGTDYDSLLRVFSDCTLANEIATNDDACGLQSELSFGSDGTSTYYIMVEGFNTASGNFSLAVTCVAAPVNDNCDGALPISCGEIVAGSTDNATVDSSVAPQCDTTVTAPGVWYVYEDTTGLITDITITMCNGTTDYDSKLSVYTGDCGAPPLNCVVGNDDTCGLQSEVSFQSDGFTTFYILVHGFGGATGNFEIEMTCTPVPPPNDMIANSIDVDEIGFPYTDPSVAMPAATGEAGSPADCNNAGSRGVWYNFTPTGDGTATATISTPGGGLLFTVNNGPLAGSYNAIAAAFGGEFTSTLITEDTAVILDDDTTGDPNDACDPILNGADLSGKIAIARRGACAFTDKVIAAQNAGAIAVIMVNNAPGDPIVMGGTNPDITIPSLMLSDVDGEAIIAELSGASVNVSMGLAPAGFSSVTFYTAPNENAVETDLVLVDWFENQCLPGSTASIPTVAGQAYYVYVVNHPAITDIVIDGTNLGTVDNTIEGFVYYPNPAESTLNLRAQDNIERVALYNILGQKVIDQKVDATTSQLNVSELATGAYIMKVSVNGQLGTYKILKK